MQKELYFSKGTAVSVTDGLPMTEEGGTAAVDVISDH